ncbi:MAG: patatin-like phospholipase family protein [Beijerinckiaceae bacterium]
MMFMPKLPSPLENQASDFASARVSSTKPSGTEPVVGLALGGGSARGWAHIGILKKLDEAGIRPTVVVGTSIGAVVGGSWAAGKLNELEDFARSITKRSMLGMMDLRLVGSGLLSGDRLRRQLEERFQGSLIEELPIKFAAVSTEIRTGHEIWLTRGQITDAMRASYALPGIFVPVQIGGRWLMDGALSNPVPVSVARALGAEMIIAVNLHTDVLGRSGVVHEHGGMEPGLATLPSQQQDAAQQGLMASVYGAASRVRRQFGSGANDKESAPGILSVMLDAFNITQDRIARSRLAGDPPDVTVGPKIGGIGLSEFHRADEAIAAGEAAVLKVIDDILDIHKALSVRK